jgi:hypothetical protein
MVSMYTPGLCLNETYTKVLIVKNLSDALPIQNGLTQGYALSPILFNFALQYSFKRDWNLMENNSGLR